MKKKWTYQPPANGYPEWNNNPEIFEVNRIPACFYGTFRSITEACAMLPAPPYGELNGPWKFAFAENPDSRIKDFY